MQNYSYVTLLSDDTYVYGVVLLVEGLKQTQSKYPLHVVITHRVSAPTFEILRQLGVTYELVDTIETTPDIYEHNLRFNAKVASVWRDCWTKFRIFDLVQFDKIVFLDADIMILKNLDHLFECPHMTSCLDGEYFNLWPGWDHFNSGCLVIEPSHELFESIYTYAKNLKEEELPEYIFADQEVLNFYYKDWPEHKELHLNKYYDIFPPYIQEYQKEDVKENCYFLHYVGRKPWTFWLRNPAENYVEDFYNDAKLIIQNHVNTFDWKKIHSYVKLTTYAICKNEINNLDNWINSFIESDYVCVLDTGSTDGTWEKLQEYAKKYNNLIVKQQIIKPWHFAKARNASMTLIPEDTVIYFMADLDELIKQPGWSQIVRDSWDPLFDRGQYKYHRDIEDGNIIRTIYEYRFHSKSWQHWENVVHEALINFKGEKQFYVETCTNLPIEVFHYGAKDKKTNYMELCEEDLKENPEDWVMHLQLAIEYEIRNEQEKAANHYKFLIDTPNTLQPFELARCYFGYGMYQQVYQNNLRLALHYYREGRLIAPDYADNYLGSAEILFNQGQYNSSIELCKAAFTLCKNAFWCSRYDMKSYLPYHIMALCYYNLRDELTALSYSTIAVAKMNTNPDLVKLQNELINQVINKM